METPNQKSAKFWPLVATFTALLCSVAGQAQSGSLQISEVKIFTLPANPVCGKPVRLVTEIFTNEPGTVEFTLHRRIGRKQKASLTTDRVGDGYAKRWHKHFVYTHSITREYMVVVKGHDYETSWIPVDVSCKTGPQLVSRLIDG